MIIRLNLFLRNVWRRGILMIAVLLMFNSAYGSELSVRVDSLNMRAYEIYTDDNPLRAIEIATDALKLADSIQYIKGLSTSNNYLGIFHYGIASYSQAEVYFMESIDLRKKLGNEEGIAHVYANLCVIREELGDYPASINYGFKALNIFDRLGKADSNSKIHMNLGLAHYSNGDTKDAHKYYRKGLEIAKEKADSAQMALIYYNWANLYKKNNEIDTAEKLYKKALTLNRISHDKRAEGDAYAGLANAAIEKKEYRKALELFEKSIIINEELKDSFGLYYNYLERSELFLRKNEYKKALEDIKKAEIHLDDTEGFEFYEKLNRQYATIYNGLKDYKNSIFYLQKAEDYKDLTFNIAKSRTIARLQKENAEREKAEAETAKAEEELKNQKLTQSLLIFGLLSIGLLFGLYVMNQRRIQKSRELSDYKDQQERIIDRRIINATQEIRKELAHNLHNHVATPLTHIKRFIEPIYQQLSFDPEWQANLMQALQIADKAHGVSRDISYQLKPEKIDWIDRIKISMVALERNKTMRTKLEVKGLSETAFTRIEGEKISSIISNLLSNVDKHSKATKVNVTITQTATNLDIEVVDNGIGFRPAQDKGIGLDSIDAGVKELKGVIHLDSKEKEGTTVKISLPVTNTRLEEALSIHQNLNVAN